MNFIFNIKGNCGIKTIEKIETLRLKTHSNIENTNGYSHLITL